MQTANKAGADPELKVFIRKFFSCNTLAEKARVALDGRRDGIAVPFNILRAAIEACDDDNERLPVLAMLLPNFSHLVLNSGQVLRLLRLISDDDNRLRALNFIVTNKRHTCVITHKYVPTLLRSCFRNAPNQLSAERLLATHTYGARILV